MNHRPGADLVATVAARHDAADGVVVLELVAPSLPDWRPGAHVDVLLPGGLARQYSLCGAPGAPRWRLGIQLEAQGAGSRWLAEHAVEGAELPLAGPRSHFRFDEAEDRPVAFVAGGIGITPILPMAAAAAVADRDYRLHYLGRGRSRLAFLDELAATHGDRLELHLSEEGGRLDLDAFVAGLADRTVVVACGPARMLDALEAAGAAHGVEVRMERFEAGELAAPVRDEPFEVELATSGIAVEVPPGVSVLEAVEAAGAFVLSSCTEGTCGTCETRVLAGAVDHRDSILSPAERAANDVMYVCVSRAAGPRLVLDL